MDSIQWLENHDNITIRIQALQKKERQIAEELAHLRRQLDDMKDSMRDYMLQHGVKSEEIDLGDVTTRLSLVAGRKSVVINDLAAIPPEFCEVVIKPDKLKIKEYLDGGAQCNWAYVESGKPYIAIRNTPK